VAARLAELGGGAGFGDLFREDVPREWLCRRIGGVVDHEAMWTEDVLDPVAERLGHAAPRLVRPTQAVHDLGTELRVGQRRAQGPDGREDVVGEGEPRDGALAGAGEVFEADGLRGELGIEHRTPGHLGPVVILRVNPEHGHNRHAVVAFNLGRQLHRGERFEKREQRAAKEAGLLARDHHARAGIGQTRGRGARFGRRLSARLLIRDDPRQRLGAARRGLRPADRVFPRGRAGGIAREERLDLRVLVRVIRRQAANPRKLSDVDGQGSGGRWRGRVGRHRRVLSQSLGKHVNSAW
jgi:hypothetical protein